MSTKVSLKKDFTIGGDLKVRRMGYGAMRLTGKGIWGPPRDHDEAIRVLKVGGEARFSLTPAGVYDMEWTFKEPYHQAIADFLTDAFGAKVIFSFGAGNL